MKRLGNPDSNIILMLADDVDCNARNTFPGCVYHNSGRTLDLYGDNIEVDYRGNEVTVENDTLLRKPRQSETLHPQHLNFATNRILLDGEFKTNIPWP